MIRPAVLRVVSALLRGAKGVPTWTATWGTPPREGATAGVASGQQHRLAQSASAMSRCSAAAARNVSAARANNSFSARSA